MNAKLIQLAQRRQSLIEQSDRQRAALAQAAVPWQNALARADQGIAMLRYLKSHPVWLAAGGSLVLAVLGPGRVWRWIGRGLVGLQLLGKLRIR